MPLSGLPVSFGKFGEGGPFARPQSIKESRDISCYTADGQPAKGGEIAYAAMHFSNRTVALYRFQPKGEDTADFFDANGQSAKSMLMKTPVDGARISLGFTTASNAPAPINNEAMSQ